MGFLIDSTVLIDAERRGGTPADFIESIIERLGDAELAISVMSAAELFHGCARASTSGIRARREEFVESVLLAVPAAPVTMTVARVFGAVDAQLSARGRRIPAADLLIASTALVRGDAIVTADRRHFARVRDLTVHLLK